MIMTVTMMEIHTYLLPLDGVLLLVRDGEGVCEEQFELCDWGSYELAGM